MPKELKYGLYLDFYGAFLTENQRSTLLSYYNDDLSLSEIAEEQGVTRQGVMDVIRRGERKLDELEKKLRFCEKYEITMGAIDGIEAAAAEISDGVARSRIKEQTALVRAIWEDENGI